MASMTQPSSPRPLAQPPLRFVTATSIFDGHDAAINIIRRLLQSQGAEVVHLGHNRGVEDIVRAALQEDAEGIAVSSYQGGHLEFFRYLMDCLKAAGAGEMRVFAGGGQLERPEEAIDSAPDRTRETAHGGSLPSLSAAGSLFQVDR